MAGILNSKTRFIDLVITPEGRRQITSGDLRAEFASFTDTHAFYDKGLGAKDASDRIYFQAMDRPENVIVIEKDDSGKLIETKFSVSSSIVGDAIFTTTQSSDLNQLLASTGDEFASLSNEFVSASINHFQKNRLISTHEFPSDDTGGFEIDKKNVSFTISNSIPFPAGPSEKTINVNNAEPFLLDARLGHLPNLQFLPPVNEDGSAYGSYSDFRNTTKSTWEDIKNHLGSFAFSESDQSIVNSNSVRRDTSGDFEVFNRENLVPVSTPLPKDFKTINFEKNSEFKNILFQMYEVSSGSSSNVNPLQNTIKKLDIVDGGLFFDENDPNGKFEKQVFYVGKVFFDDYNTPTFVNIFTLVMD